MNSRKEEMEVKQKKNTSLLFGGETLWQVERREAKVRRRLGRKQRGGSTREQAQRKKKDMCEVTERRGKMMEITRDERQPPFDVTVL